MSLIVVPAIVIIAISYVYRYNMSMTTYLTKMLISLPLCKDPIELYDNISKQSRQISKLRAAVPDRFLDAVSSHRALKVVRRSHEGRQALFQLCASQSGRAWSRKLNF